MKAPEDEDLGRLLSWVVALLVLAIVYLVILLPFSGNAGVVVGAITALTGLIGAIVTVRAIRRRDQ
jgi:type II secretory pathway component PulM